MLDKNTSILKGYTLCSTGPKLDKTLFSRGQVMGQAHLDNLHVLRLVRLEF